MDILEEEKCKYELIRGKLIDYRKDLDDSLVLAQKIEDPNMASIMTRVYRRQIELYEKNKNNPYFAKIIFSGDDEPIVAYIGRIGFADLNDDDIIVDWRAPISELYYNSKIGPAQYKIDNVVVRGRLDLKRQIVFKEGNIEAVYDIDNQLSTDDFLLPYLTGSADNRLKNIVSTIQEEQDNIIRKPINRDIIVQGVAGCGKTTVALHRLSYLIYNYREAYTADKYYIISPNKLFKKYITGLLEDLDADQSTSTTISQMAEQIWGDYKILEKHKQFEKLQASGKSVSYLKYKTSKAFKIAIDKFIVDYEKQIFSKSLTVSGVELLRGETLYSVYSEVDQTSVEEKVAIWVDRVNYLLRTSDEVKNKIIKVTENGIINLKQKFDIEHHLQKGFTKELNAYFNKNINIIDFYKAFLERIDYYIENKEFGEIIKNEAISNLNNKIVSDDDLGVLLYLNTKIKADKEKAGVCHVLIDEAQDISYLQFCAMKNMFKNATFSIFGDLAQSLYEYQVINSWQEIFDVFENNQFVELRKSYRTTVEITQNANEQLKYMGLNLAENVIRHGEPVEYLNVQNDNICDALKEEVLGGLLKYKTIAIVCKDDNEVSQLKEKKLFEGNENVEIMTCMQIKGLEFEVAIIYNENSYSKTSLLDQKQLYVAKTRALHKLIVNRVSN